MTVLPGVYKFASNLTTLKFLNYSYTTFTNEKPYLMLLPLAILATGCSDDPTPNPTPKIDVIDFETCMFPERQSNNLMIEQTTTYTELREITLADFREGLNFTLGK